MYDARQPKAPSTAKFQVFLLFMLQTPRENLLCQLMPSSPVLKTGFLIPASSCLVAFGMAVDVWLQHLPVTNLQKEGTSTFCSDSNKHRNWINRQCSFWFCCRLSGVGWTPCLPWWHSGTSCEIWNASGDTSTRTCGRWALWRTYWAPGLLPWWRSCVTSPFAVQWMPGKWRQWK